MRKSRWRSRTGIKAYGPSSSRIRCRQWAHDSAEPPAGKDLQMEGRKKPQAFARCGRTGDLKID
jgi:hypothetical protein